MENEYIKTVIEQYNKNKEEVYKIQMKNKKTLLEMAGFVFDDNEILLQQNVFDLLDYYSKVNSKINYEDFLTNNDILLINKLINSTSSTIETIKSDVRNMSVNALKYFFNEYIAYRCNSSEMNARLVNFKKEFDSVDVQTKSKYIFNNMFYKLDYFRKHSKTFNEYFNIYQILTVLLDVCDIDDKRTIANEDIKRFYDYEYNHPKLKGNVYQRTFVDNNGKYSEKSFDSFCFYHKMKVRDIFITKAVEMSGNIKVFENMLPIKRIY